MAGGRPHAFAISSSRCTADIRTRQFRRSFAFIFLTLLALLLGAHPAFAQNATATGEITDPSGAAVANAQVTLTNNQSHAEQHANTNSAGLFSFPSVQAGNYTLTVDANGFTRYQKTDVTVTGGQNLTLDVTLQLQSASQSVTVREDYQSLEEVANLDKTGTKLVDLPGSVQVISKAVLTAQGATMLSQGVTNASGVNYGGSDSKGFYDHFLIRGLNAQVYEDSFSDGDLLNGISHSLNGVESVEVLEGPGSALFGSGAPGGTIDILHYTPSPEFEYGGSVQGGSFGALTNNDYIAGPTGVAGLNYRIDATFSRADGFRALRSHDYEVRPALEWHVSNHMIDLAVDAREIHETPDSYGLIYFNGAPITNVPSDSKYSTPFAWAHEGFVRPTLTDTWVVRKFLTINNRFSFLHRTPDYLGNGDSTRTHVSGDEVIGRQLRQQSDSDNNFDYQFEPVWNFATGSLHHTLLTGFEYLHQTIATQRDTADLPDIPDVFAPVPPETSTAGLTFLCDASHSCDDDHLSANYFSLYATDQLDVTDRFKVRAGVREDWFDTSLTPLITVPGAVDSEGQPLLGGVTYTRNDAPASWNAGALYKVTSSIVPYFGVSTSHLANFNSESAQSGIGAPEAALQYEAGIKFPLFQNRVALNTAVFDVTRNNVATPVTLNGIEAVVFDAQRTKGFEASFDSKVTDRWNVLANVTYQDPVITDNPQGIASIGNRPQGAPAHMANLWSTYDFSIAGVSGFRVGAGLNYMGETFSDITNVNHIPSYVVGNAMFGYAKSAWSFDLNVDNFTDERYFLAANEAGAYVGNPIAVYARVSWNMCSHK
jgi:iron complex outermembrane recepter protein